MSDTEITDLPLSVDSDLVSLLSAVALVLPGIGFTLIRHTRIGDQHVDVTVMVPEISPATALQPAPVGGAGNLPPLNDIPSVVVI